jgi:hypothetical protein
MTQGWPSPMTSYAMANPLIRSIGICAPFRPRVLQTR